MCEFNSNNGLQFAYLKTVNNRRMQFSNLNFLMVFPQREEILPFLETHIYAPTPTHREM